MPHLEDRNPSLAKDDIKDVFRSLLKGIDYIPPIPNDQQKRSLTDSLRSEFSVLQFTTQRGTHKWFETAYRLGATMAEMAYPKHPHEAKLLIARFTFLVLYIDDFGHRFPSSLEAFQLSMLCSQDTRDEPILQRFRAHLCDIYSCWDPISANCIVSSAVEFVSGCILENHEDIRNMKISASAQSWPYYLRQKTGVSSAYAFMIFPRDPSYNVSDFIQVIGDIMVFINLANDVLSFYKEEMANETGTYVHNRSHVTGKSAIDTLKDASLEAIEAYSRVSSALKSHSAASYELWKTFVPGYVACHMSEPRYRLAELDL